MRAALIVWLGVGLGVGGGCWVRTPIACAGANDCPSGSECVRNPGANEGLCTATEGTDLAVDAPDLAGIDQAGAECEPGTTATANDACPPGRPICDFDGRCRACGRNAECASDICLADGHCGALAQTAIVDRAATCVGADGSSGKPYCEISDALASLQGRTVIRVRGAAAAYGPFAITTPIEIVGADSGSALDAVVQGGATSAVTSTNVSGAVVVTGLRLAGTSGGKPNLRCTATASATTLTLRRLVIVDGDGFGVDSDGCALAASALRVVANRAGGIVAANAPVTIESSILSGNAGPGIELDTTDAITLRGLTLGDNQATMASGRAGGVHNRRAGVTATISGSILWNNSLLAGSPLYGTSGTDLVANVAIDNANTSPPDFRSNTDFHLAGRTANNTACCIDKVATGPAFDVDGQPRPLGAKVDIGADELP